MKYAEDPNLQPHPKRYEIMNECFQLWEIEVKKDPRNRNPRSDYHRPHHRDNFDYRSNRDRYRKSRGRPRSYNDGYDSRYGQNRPYSKGEQARQMRERNHHYRPSVPSRSSRPSPSNLRRETRQSETPVGKKLTNEDTFHDIAEFFGETAYQREEKAKKRQHEKYDNVIFLSPLFQSPFLTSNVFFLRERMQQLWKQQKKETNESTGTEAALDDILSGVNLHKKRKSTRQQSTRPAKRAKLVDKAEAEKQRLLAAAQKYKKK